MFPLRDTNPHQGSAFVVWLLVLANVLVFFYGLSLGSEREALTFVFDFAMVPSLLFDDPIGNGYRLLTSMFLHGGLFHLLGNMFFLWVFGDNVEHRLGHIGFLVFYLLGGVVASLAHALVTPGSPVPMVGASGAISAVLGGYIVLFPQHRVLTLVPPFFLLWLPAWLYLGYWALIQFVEAAGGLVVSEGAVSNVAWWAHAGGFVFGALVVVLFARRGRQGRGERREW